MVGPDSGAGGARSHACPLVVVLVRVVPRVSAPPRLILQGERRHISPPESSRTRSLSLSKEMPEREAVKRPLVALLKALGASSWAARMAGAAVHPLQEVADLRK